MTTERTIIEDWDGPVCVGDRGFEEIDDAAEHYWDVCFNGETEDINQVPEFAEACDEQGPYLDAETIIESMDNYDRNCHSDDNYASQSVTPEEKAELQQFLDGWLSRISWRMYSGNGKFIRLRPLVEDCEKQNQHRQRMHQAMDYAGT